MARGVKISDEIIIKALFANGGIIQYAANDLKMDRSSLSVRVNGSEKLKAATQEAVERIVDLAEDKLLGKIRAGNMTAIIFYLKTKGRARGYVERQELTGQDGGKIIVEIQK